MLIHNKRAFVTDLAGRLGAIKLLEKLGARPGLLVLTYHRIGDPAATDLYAPVVSATPEGLREQLNFLRRAYRVVGLDDAVAMASGGLRSESPTVLVTFDDGTRDNAEVAAPILREVGVPAAFFLSTGLIDRPRLPWYDHVAYVINNTKVNFVRLSIPAPIEVDLRATPKAEAIGIIVRACLTNDIEAKHEAGFLGELESRAEVAVDSESLGRSLFMTWEQARGLVASGMGVGSHAESHRKLGALPEVDQRGELARSKATLDRELGRETSAVAYPYGWSGAFTEATTRLAGEVGYRAGFTAIEGPNRPGRSDPLALRRINVGATDTPEMVRGRLALLAAVGRSPI